MRQGATAWTAADWLPGPPRFPGSLTAAMARSGTVNFVTTYRPLRGAHLLSRTAPPSRLEVAQFAVGVIWSPDASSDGGRDNAGAGPDEQSSPRAAEGLIQPVRMLPIGVVPM